MISEVMVCADLVAVIVRHDDDMGDLEFTTVRRLRALV
jgi:hypothetical protein